MPNKINILNNKNKLFLSVLLISFFILNPNKVFGDGGDGNNRCIMDGDLIPVLYYDVVCDSGKYYIGLDHQCKTMPTSGGFSTTGLFQGCTPGRTTSISTICGMFKTVNGVCESRTLTNADDGIGDWGSDYYPINGCLASKYDGDYCYPCPPGHVCDDSTRVADCPPGNFCPGDDLEQLAFGIFPGEFSQASLSSGLYDCERGYYCEEGSVNMYGSKDANYAPFYVYPGYVLYEYTNAPDNKICPTLLNKSSVLILADSRKAGSISQCYAPLNTELSDAAGTFVYNSECYYK